MDTIQKTQQYEQYQDSRARRFLAWIWVEIEWLTGFFLMTMSTAVMCAVSFVNGIGYSFTPNEYTKYKSVFMADWYWVSGWSHLDIPISVNFPNAIWPLMLATGTYLFSKHCPWPKTILIIYTLSLTLIFWLGTRYLGIYL